MHSKQYPDYFDDTFGYYHGFCWEIIPQEWNGMILEGHSGNGLLGSAAMYMNQTEKYGFILLVNKMDLRHITTWSLTHIGDELHNLYLESTEK